MKGCVFLKPKTSYADLVSATTQGIQQINLHILAIGNHCSNSDAQKELAKLKSRRDELYQQMTTIKYQIPMKRF